MTSGTEDRRMSLQRLEFDAVEQLAAAFNRLPAVVDDDYPAMRHAYERALTHLIAALRANGRASTPKAVAHERTTLPHGCEPTLDHALVHLRSALDCIIGSADQADVEQIEHDLRSAQAILLALAERLGTPINEAVKCRTCEGCGKIANDDDRTPWTRWLALPLGSAAAVVAGLVRPIPCPDCGGSGRLS